MLEVDVVSGCREDNDETTMPARSGDEAMTRAKTTGRRVRNAQQQTSKPAKACGRQAQGAGGGCEVGSAVRGQNVPEICVLALLAILC